MFECVANTRFSLKTTEKKKELTCSQKNEMLNVFIEQLGVGISISTSFETRLLKYI